LGLHLLLGLLTGWFFVQGFKLLFGLAKVGGIPRTGLIFRVWGIQLAFLQFIIVWLVDKHVWEKKREHTRPSPVNAKEVALLFGAILCYAVGAALINLIRLF